MTDQLDQLEVQLRVTALLQAIQRTGDMITADETVVDADKFYKFLLNGDVPEEPFLSYKED